MAQPAGSAPGRRAWAAIRGDVLTSLGLPGDPDALLAGHAGALDAAYREVAGRLAVNTEVTIGDDGKTHLTGVKAVEEPPSLTHLRKRTAAMLPRVDLPEVILEVMSWAPEAAALSGGARYSPTTSRILASSSGSVLNLNVSIRCGWRCHLRQIRATDANEIPSSVAIKRADQWVIPSRLAADHR
jgi:hypothetical protein